MVNLADSTHRGVREIPICRSVYRLCVCASGSGITDVSVIVQRYVDAMGTANVSVLRDGQVLNFEQINGEQN